MPESLATRCGSIESSKQAWIRAARDRIVPATRAQGRDAAFIVAVREAQRVGRQRLVMQFRLGDIGHSAASLRASRFSRSATAALDEAGGDRRAVIMQDGDEARRIDGAFIDQQLHQLRVAVLLDHEDLFMRVDEFDDLVGEGEGAHAQRVDIEPFVLELEQGLVHGRRRRAVIDRAVAGILLGLVEDRLGQQRLGGLELAQQPLHVVDIDRALFAVARVGVAAGAAREIGAARGDGRPAACDREWRRRRRRDSGRNPCRPPALRRS